MYYASDPNLTYEGRRLFDHPARINHLMSKNTKDPYQTSNISKKNYHKMNIINLSGPGVIIAEEDIIFKRNDIENFIASSTVKCKSSKGLLYEIKLADLERETRTQVRS
jgi:hypothetical protein